MGTEGFITYNHASLPFSTKTVEIYSTDNPVTKIYDDIYYDPRNGNVVVVYTKGAYTVPESADAEGKTIKSIEIVSRKNDIAFRAGRTIEFRYRACQKDERTDGRKRQREGDGEGDGVRTAATGSLLSQQRHPTTKTTN